MKFGKYILFAAGAYALWRSRFKIQSLLEEIGINTPWITDTAGDAIQSGAAKISGGVKHDLDTVRI